MFKKSGTDSLFKKTSFESSPPIFKTPFSSVRVQLWFLQNKNLDISLFRNFYSIFVIQKPASLVLLYF